MKLAIYAAVLLATLAMTPRLRAAECDFACTLKLHLDAIQARDLPAFLNTITQGEKLSFILPNGHYVDARADYVEMLSGWFAQTGWHFNYEIVHTVVGSDLGLALLLVSYDEDDRNGEPYHIDHYLSLLFQKEPSGWRLVHDQNTLTQLTEDEK